MVQVERVNYCYIEGLQVSPPTDLIVDIWSFSDLPVIEVVAHAVCFDSARDQGIKHNHPGEQGRIPSGARCVFCGEKLPVIGQHPYVVEVKDSRLSSQYWAHTSCMQDVIQIEQGA